MDTFFDITGLPNYTGPYISDGKIQSSVEFGEKTPKDELDALSRLHDSAYAKWKDKLHRTAADEIYNTEAKKLGKKFPELAGLIVLYGNQAARATENLVEGASFGPLGFVAGGLKNMYDLNEYLIYGERTKKEVRKYYETDPHKNLQLSEVGIELWGGQSQQNIGPIYTEAEEVHNATQFVYAPPSSEKTVDTQTGGSTVDTVREYTLKRDAARRQSRDSIDTVDKNLKLPPMEIQVTGQGGLGPTTDEYMGGPNPLNSRGIRKRGNPKRKKKRKIYNPRPL